MTFHTNGGTENMRIDSICAVTKPNQPAFLSKLSGNQTNITADGSHQTRTVLIHKYLTKMQILILVIILLLHD
jgi:hypothetical protein